MRAHCNRWLLVLLLLGSTPAPAAYHWEGIGDCYSDIGNCDEFGVCTPVPSHFVGVCFRPASLTIAAGDSVTFSVTDVLINTGPHNVVADDGSFRCALGCDGEGGDGTPRDVTSRWSFTRTFNTPGVVKYHDEVTGVAGVVNVVSLPKSLTTVTVEYYYADWNFLLRDRVSG
jgi:plastocyanin